MYSFVQVPVKATPARIFAKEQDDVDGEAERKGIEEGCG
jgi:hypothetical protein